jgi:hypothetical protein
MAVRVSNGAVARWIFFLALFFLLLLGASGVGLFLLSTKTIRGYARDAQTNAPLSGVSVEFAGRTAQTDSKGAFEFRVPRGKYVLHLGLDGYEALDRTFDASALLGTEFFTDIPLVPAGVRVQVVAADSGQPLAGARVQTDTQQLATDALGTVVILRSPNGTRVRVSAESYVPTDFTLEANTQFVVKLSPVLIPITVLDQGNQQPLPRATLNVNGLTVTTDDRGTANLRNLSAGNVIRVTAVEHDPLEISYNGEKSITARLRSNAPVVVRGTLLDAPTQKPIANATVWLNNLITRTDEAGNFVFPNNPRLTEAATLTVKAVGYRMQRTPLTQTTSLRFTLYPFQVHGLHIYYGMPRAQVLALLDRLRGTELNAVVIDVKSDRGEIVWDSAVPLARQVKAYAKRGIDLSELIDECRARNLYCIARTVIAKDDKLAFARPDLALHTLGGAIYVDNTAAWLNIAKKEVHDYAMALSKELVAIGFDEVQIDYIRFPGNFGISETGTPDSRVAAVKILLANAQSAFRAQPAFLSGDVFGLTTLTDDENNIGQRLREMAPYLDYISPMEYPDTYNAGMLQAMGVKGCTVPRYCPYDTVYRSTLGAIERAGTTKVRAWIQAYGWGTADYLQERKAAEEARSYGYMWWNNEGIYDDRLFKR